MQYTSECIRLNSPSIFEFCKIGYNLWKQQTILFQWIKFKDLTKYLEKPGTTMFNGNTMIKIKSHPFQVNSVLFRFSFGFKSSYWVHYKLNYLGNIQFKVNRMLCLWFYLLFCQTFQIILMKLQSACLVISCRYYTCLTCQWPSCSLIRQCGLINTDKADVLPVIL